MFGLRRELRERLGRADFLRGTRNGQRVDTDHFRVFVLHRGDGGAARLGITVTRKVGKAVRRNRIKRLVREWFRSCSHEMGPCDLIVVVKRDLPVGLRLRDVQRDLDRGLRPFPRRASSC